MAAKIDPEQQEKITAKIERVRFHNPDNSYCILALDNGVTAVGYMPSIRTGDEYEFTGTWKTHPKFGKQFAFTEHQMLMPSSREGLISYLCSVATGIGPVKAGRIVETLRDDCLDKIQADPGVLAKVPGVTPEQAEEIHKALTENRVLAELTALICGQGITPRLAAKIYKQYGAESLDVVKENPYVLADEMFGVGFKTADKIARAVGIPEDSPYRIKAAVKWLLNEAGNDGHCYLRPSEIMARLPEALGMRVEVAPVAAAVKALQERGEVVREGDCIYYAKMYEAEKELAGRVRGMVAGNG
ncbi:helix-hairpin-helix domain-containing protein [Moorella stamsii]|nr:MULTISPECIES: helix-hairpin-helix domain-containing protein [Moorella]